LKRWQPPSLDCLAKSDRTNPAGVTEESHRGVHEGVFLHLSGLAARKD
jgi:hypothetical protein